MERFGVKMRVSALSTAPRTAVLMPVRPASFCPTRLVATDSHTLHSALLLIQIKSAKCLHAKRHCTSSMHGLQKSIARSLCSHAHLLRCHHHARCPHLHTAFPSASSKLTGEPNCGHAPNLPSKQTTRTDGYNHRYVTFKPARQPHPA